MTPPTAKVDAMHLEVVADAAHATRAVPILFVHGAWHAAWCWENFLPYFAQRGYASYAVSLRGHGASAGRDRIRWHSPTRDYVADVARVAETLGRPPILVGHSLGGYLVQRYLETHAAPAAILLASLPAAGCFGFMHRYRRRHPWPALKALATLSPWHMVATPALVQDTLFSPQVPAEDVARHHARLQPETFRIVTETAVLRLPRPGGLKTPLLVLGAANDRVFSVAEQEATARAFATTAEILPDMAHDMMLEPNWRQAADRILGWLQDRGL